MPLDHPSPSPAPPDTPWPLFCRRCAIPLTPGRGDFYVVRVEAFADPSPPLITAEDLAKDHAQVLRELLAQIEKMSPQEAMDTIYRRLDFFLCGPCYRQWIEDPVR